jgi:hypothetical protein
LDNITYTLWWLSSARRDMTDRSEDKHRTDDWYSKWTSINYSGGPTGWDERVKNIYFKPINLEERLLQHEVHEVMIAALQSAMSLASRSPADAMDIGQAYRLARMVAHVDPLISALLKVRLNNLCVKLKENNTLFEQAHNRFEFSLGMVRPDLCLTW